MRKNVLAICSFFLAVSLMAQQESPVLLVSVQGKISYTSAVNKRPLKVRSGAALKPSGVLKVGKNARVILYCLQQFVEIKMPGEYVLEKICTTNGYPSLGFEHEFGEYLLASMHLMEFAKNREQHWVKTVTNSRIGGDGWGTGVPESKTSGGGGSGWGTGVPESKTSGGGGSGWGTGVPESKTSGGGGSGWGTTNDKVTPIFPFGIITSNTTAFFWSNPAKSRSFLFEIMDEANNTIHSANLQDTFVQVFLSKLNLKTGEKYRWKVSIPGKPESSSKELSFEIGLEEKKNASLKKALAMPLLKSGNDINLQMLAEAVALEEAEWHYAAYEKYLQIRSSNPTNLSRMMHAAFLMRFGLQPLAEKAAQ